MGSYLNVLGRGYGGRFDMLRLRVWAAAFGAALCNVGAIAGDIVAPSVLYAGEKPNIRIINLSPNQRVVVHAVRVSDAAVQKDGQWSTEKRLTKAFGEFVAGPDGRVDVAKKAPVRGTWNGVDARGLLWSGYLPKDPEARKIPAQVEALVTEVPPGVVRLLLEEDGRISASHSIRMRGRKSNVKIDDVKEAGLIGAFAQPGGEGPHPAVLLLHGSEGGAPPDLRARAVTLANQGYAAFAISYFAWPYQQVEGVPQAFVNLPVESVARALDWLSAQPSADTERLAVVGISKGAELALLAATQYPRIKHVVACVPSDVVWSGFGGTAPPGGQISSWSIGGKPLPDIPYTDWNLPALKDATTGARHRHDLAAASTEMRKAAAIDFSNWTARVLLIAGGRDETWPSLPMAQEALARIRAAQPDKTRSKLLGFPDAGHFICGTGNDAARLWGDDPFRNGGGLASANGKAASKAWDETLTFLGGM